MSAVENSFNPKLLKRERPRRGLAVIRANDIHHECYHEDYDTMMDRVEAAVAAPEAGGGIPVLQESTSKKKLMKNTRRSMGGPQKAKQASALSEKQWRSAFTATGGWIKMYEGGCLLNGGLPVLMAIKEGGCEHSIRHEVWPFLLGMYDPASTAAERQAVRDARREKYEELRRQAEVIGKRSEEEEEQRRLHPVSSDILSDSNPCLPLGTESSVPKCPSTSFDFCNRGEVWTCTGAREQCGANIGRAELTPEADGQSRHESCPASPTGASKTSTMSPRSLTDPSSVKRMSLKGSGASCNASPSQSPRSNLGGRRAESGEECDSRGGMREEEMKRVASRCGTTSGTHPACGSGLRHLRPWLFHPHPPLPDRFYDGSPELSSFAYWQRAMRLDAVRLNGSWVPFSAQRVFSEEMALAAAASVGLLGDESVAASVDTDALNVPQLVHAARLVAILEAYAVLDPDIGFCQGMADLLSPFVALMPDDSDAFWSFHALMTRRGVRQNFRPDGQGIRRQLAGVASIVRLADPELFAHLGAIGADDCMFVYRMLIVLLRRELSFEKTLTLWEALWVDALVGEHFGVRHGLHGAEKKAGAGGARGRLRKEGGLEVADEFGTENLLLFVIAAIVCWNRATVMACEGVDDVLRLCYGLAKNVDVWDLLQKGKNLAMCLNGCLD